MLDPGGNLTDETLAVDFDNENDVVRDTERLPADETFYEKFGKRWLDFCLSSLGLILFSPVFLLVSAVIKTTSRGPALFRQVRVGWDGRLFRILKFRTMVEDAESQGPGFTRNNDPRITAVGQWLRKWKLDELPQLCNVLRGEMSFVGPRPELPKYVAQYTADQLRVLRIRPGVTDLASLRYRNEGDVLLRSSDPERLYREQILPDKLRINLQYLHEISFARDISLIFSTLRAVFNGPK